MFRISFLLIFLVAALSGQAQSVAASEPEAFKGRLSFSIAYSGENAASWSPFLADSLVVEVSDSAVWYKAYGGLSDSLLQEYCWWVADSLYYTFDHRRQAAYRTASSPTPGKVTQRKPNGEALGFALTQLTIASDGKTSQFWVADSFVTAVAPPLAEGLYALPLRTRRHYRGLTITTELLGIILPKGEVNFSSFPHAYEVRDFDARPVRHPAIRP